ncbi:hypothetical protein [Thiorhodospira sibirica]|uniref:hypothetical protein n=1 Tax=Thiorhodospira sibirica TaxID=154347 RepID=UPI00022C1739|nr:hypothetical protein [Thiorhodospira sibirica]
MQNKDYEAQALAALKRAVNQALERKQQLGQYAVVWRDGKPLRIIPEVLTHPKKATGRAE